MTVADDLATLREAIYLSKPHHGLERDHDDYEWRVDLALEAHKRVETEIARLREERNEYAERLAWHREERDAYMKGNLWVRRAAEERERAEAAETEVARLNADADEIEQLAAEKGIPFALDHIGLDGMANEVVALHREITRLRSVLAALDADDPRPSYVITPIRAALTEVSTCSECGRDLHGYRGPCCRYCEGTAE